MSPRDKLQSIRRELQALFLERSELIDGALAGLLASQHVLIIGPPGTAKSMLADEICRRLTGSSYFHWLLTKFTTPEELFGAVSLKGLEADDYRRVTDNKLPEAHVAFLDEVFNASSSILNAILTIINERLFHNGREIMRVPLLTLFGASNELPEDDELRALYDRFLLRFTVDYISEDFRFLKMLRTVAPIERTSLTLDELRLVQTEVRAIPIPGTVFQRLADVRRALQAKDIIASDRRYRQSLGVLQALAYLDGRAEVGEPDLFFLEHVLWNEPAERQQVAAVVHSLVYGFEDEAQELLYQTRELREYAERSWDSAELQARAIIEAHTKVQRLLTRLEDIHTRAADGRRPLDKVESIRQEVQAIQKQLLAKL